MNQEFIIEKIKKLLRMKRGGTPGEVENALRMASELARKHGIDLSAVDPDAPEMKPLDLSEALSSSRFNAEDIFAALICQNFFAVKAIMMNNSAGRIFSNMGAKKILFVGTGSDREIAIYVFRFLSRHFRYCWNHRQNRLLRNRRAFMQGLYCGLSPKMIQNRQANVCGEGLIRLDRQVARREQYVADHFGAIRTETIKSANVSSAMRAGYIDGQKVQINPAVKNPAPAARQALPPTSGQIQLL